VRRHELHQVHQPDVTRGEDEIAVACGAVEDAVGNVLRRFRVAEEAPGHTAAPHRFTIDARDVYSCDDRRRHSAGAHERYADAVTAEVEAQYL
jgi:hypothetical protein